MNNYFLYFMWFALFMKINETFVTSDIGYSINKNSLSIYVFTLPKKIRKGFLNEIKHTLNITKEKVSAQLITAHSRYYSLSEDERLLIEKFIDLLF